jgi:5'-nucleotidase (lipoprotein e(P4) family)
MKYILSISLFFLLACSETKQGTKTATTTASITTPLNISLNAKLYTAFFQQRAAEYRALCFQGYNIARMRIESYVPQTEKPKAIITDIDETILDNSPYAVKQAYNGIEYTTATWYEWTDKSAADTMPGAAAFLKYVTSKNIQIFYVTNRMDRERESTLVNLKKYGLPNADPIHLYTRTDTSSKEARRLQIMDRYEVVLLMGDNLADLSNMFDKKTEAQRRDNTNNLSTEFGKKFIVFPNANYGDWESALFKSSRTQVQKDSVLKSVLKSY